MQVIYCKLNLFDARQTIELVTDEASSILATAGMKDLGDTIAAVCNEENIFKVKLWGNASYVNSIAEDIQIANTTKYHSNNTIEIEVNK